MTKEERAALKAAAEALYADVRFPWPDRDALEGEGFREPETSYMLAVPPTAILALLRDLEQAEPTAHLRACRERDRALAALRAVEWASMEGRCPWCGGLPSMGHTIGCERQAALASAEPTA